ncbi:uracil-DNA glycosylase [Cupriavidus oxalaticus]|uniref:Type-4 uracil-DNA glycosylase n=1 Tax=Cupriavidus oxalaticus TaxID=96344 RepID=A0A375FP52_9BURK|nr:uracil-DNA glycosylase [Cupriavidus oxalaticus]QRQ88816.1 uracil-DNA glycosylase [Cupriavidus oxalaticus]QRQ92858.1 uracil-DNA glycosylase [Cupriavidus oxalaticus]WQD81464.1 uracil-DNA glycosylase [Cupriavidus oxalaticus]SPC07406.1 putative uracil-DNA glycosylase,phage-related protein [Cupriavidus oxalaticus]SPC12776.1 Bacteriophage-type DNA polymerase [Cupriavidus oxalaticus]
MSRRARFLEALGITAEWVPRARDDAPQAEAVSEAVAFVEPVVEPVVEPAVEHIAEVIAEPVTVAAPAAAPVVEAAPAIETAIPVVPVDLVEAPVSRARPEPSLVPAGPEPDSAQAEREAAIAAMAWPALDAAVAGCTACGLCQTRTNTVFGVGDRQAEWMLVGEAPGENEDLQGEPFVGQAGKLLDNMLGALGLARGRNVFIANVLKCRPPGNRNPQPAEVAQCEPFLRRQIALVRPRVIVVLGRFAAQSLLRTTTPIGKLRGTVHTYEGIPVVVTYHPAYLLRTLTDKARAWEDLCLAREVHDRAGAGA